MKVLEKNKHVYGRFPPDEDYRTVKATCFASSIVLFVRCTLVLFVIGLGLPLARHTGRVMYSLRPQMLSILNFYR